ncbi:MAG: hypothetical protein J0I28_08250 [Caulobacterales bacterium]|nr:hypothetical protein [Caulobacterales bacterium]
MRRAILSTLVAAACLVAAGCHRPQASGEVQRVREGVDAFRAGDRDRLTGLLEDAKAYTRDTDPCSNRAFAETRRDAVVDLLAPLDRADLFSVSEEARFAYLARAARHAGLDDMPRPIACDGVSRRTARKDFAERRAVLIAYEDAAALWRRDLEGRYGEEELEQRLELARVTLRRNHVGEIRLSSVTGRPARWAAAWSR